MLDQIEQLLRELFRTELRRVVREEVIPLLPATEKPGSPEEDRYLTPTDAAKIAGVHEKTVKKWVARGELEAHHAGRLLRIRPGDLRAYMRRGRQREGVIDFDQRVQDILAKNQR